MVAVAAPSRLRWSKVSITIVWDDYPDHVPSLRHFLLIVSSIVTNTCLTRVLEDGGSVLNILYADTLDRMKILSHLCPSEAPFYGIIPGMQVVPIGSIQLSVMFADPSNLCKG